MSLAAGPSGLIAELEWRGLIHDRTEGLDERLRRGPLNAYVGFDPSGPSLHVGHLVQVFLLTHLQRSGGRPVALLGGGTGMIGDPSGKSAERNLLDDATLDEHKATYRAQLGQFIEFSAAPTGGIMLDNRAWLGSWGLLDYLRDIGKHFTVGYMLGKESVQERLAGGLSFTEFSYMTLQAADFLHLYREHDVEMQMGGADQWGNITAGLELIRRVEGGRQGPAADRGAATTEALAFGLCSPLLTTASGQKMGKTETGAVYLDATLTRPYDFYQYLVNQPDELVGRLLRWLTLMEREAIEALEAETEEHPERRAGQRAFALDLTTRVHGREAADRQIRAADAAFGDAPLADPSLLQELYEEAGGFEAGADVVRGGALVVALASGLFASNSEVRRALAQNGLVINEQRVAAADELVTPIAGRWLVVRAGKRKVRVGRVTG
ncbi:MAG: tyrosine--tRNA ligase [Candidatus Limnocylindrales bacterium]